MVGNEVVADAGASVLVGAGLVGAGLVGAGLVEEGAALAVTVTVVVTVTVASDDLPQPALTKATTASPTASTLLRKFTEPWCHATND
jgi:sugar (pentulose or hexulose) kinase